MAASFTQLQLHGYGIHAVWLGTGGDAVSEGVPAPAAVGNPDVVVVQETESPTGIPRHAYETPVFGIRPGAAGLHWDSWPRIDDAIAGYQVFRALRADGVLPAGLRFQVGLPFPSSALSGFKADV